jgi:hypothetical protein
MSNPADNEALLRRLEQLERDNARLREKLEPLVGPDNPNFKPQEFLKVLQRTIIVALIPVWVSVMTLPALHYLAPGWKNARVGGVPIFSMGGNGGKVRGVGMGVVSFGGVSVGAVAVGGMSIGLLAVGGCSAGVVAFGGASIGVIAVGGGACGVVAVGGGACGYFAIGQKARGKYVLAFNRQDEQAVAFFRRFIPGLSRALTNPIPVILLEPEQRVAPVPASGDGKDGPQLRNDAGQHR